MYLRVLWRGEHVAQRGDRPRGHHHGPRDGPQLWDGARHRELRVSGREMHHVSGLVHHEALLLVILQFGVSSSGF